jgi:hypothetical protein
MLGIILVTPRMGLSKVSGFVDANGAVAATFHSPG